MSDLYNELCSVAGTDFVKDDFPMRTVTSFRAGGNADFFCEVQNDDQLINVLSVCRKYKTEYFIIGNGTNLLISDKGYHGVVVRLGSSYGYINTDGEIISAGAAALLSLIAKRALDNSLTGFEFAAGIPGSAGGAVTMNAGAYGFEMKDIVVSVRVLTPEGVIKDIPADELSLSYRKSNIIQNGYTVLEIRYRLKPGNKEEIKSTMDELAAKRKSKQPLEYPSAGSTFKRPEGYFAGKLIEDAGLKGYLLGGAQVSEKHCGFIINRSQATASEIYDLCMHVKKEVKTHFGVELELEVKLLGEF